MTFTRRQLLSRTTGTAAFASFGAFGGLTQASMALARGRRDPGYGPLVQSQPDMMLPRGFSYVKGGEAFSPMRDGNPTPPAHDSMGVFRVGCAMRLVRNHELDPEDFGFVPPLAVGDKAYDRLGNGGCTILEFNPLPGTLRRELAGAGRHHRELQRRRHALGHLADVRRNDRRHAGRAGATARLRIRNARKPPAGAGDPLKAMGRFVHEGCAVDPSPASCI